MVLQVHELLNVHEYSLGNFFSVEHKGLMIWRLDEAKGSLVE